MGLEVSWEFSLLALVVVAACVVNYYMMKGVGAARQKYGVRYPDMYGVESENKDAKLFNCIQRGHQNFLEIVPFFFTLLLTAGLQHPRIATLAGAFFLVSRVTYFRDYSTGEPKRRMKGARRGYFSLLVLMICTVSFAGHQLWAAASVGLSTFRDSQQAV